MDQARSFSKFNNTAHDLMMMKEVNLNSKNSNWNPAKFDKRCKEVNNKQNNDQRNLEPNWTRGVSDHTQSKVLVSDTTSTDD